MISRPSRPTPIAVILGVAALSVGACTTSERAAPPPVPVAVTSPAAPTFSGPVLTGDGSCTGPAPATAAAIEIGIGECDLVRLKGKPPTDVLVGEGRSGREVQVLYTEPGAKELYFFVNAKLDRIVK